jgi:ornithine cyclodeaminase/alanine dehydrogenase-like protein (mu-crystallin family)
MTASDLEPGELLFLDRTAVETLLDPGAVLQRCIDTFTWVGEGEVDQRNPVNLYLHDRLGPEPEFGHGVVQAFPALIKPLQVAGVKWLASFRKNPKRGLPAISATGVLNDAETGMPLAVFDATSVTNFRTGGHAGVGAKYMARPDSSVVAILGCGNGGRSHLRTMAEIFDIEHVTAFDIVPEARTAFAEEMGELLGVTVTESDSVETAVRDADIICVTTTAPEPILFEAWIRPGAHVCATTGFRDVHVECVRSFDKFAVGWYGRDLEWIDGEETGRIGGVTPGSITRGDIYADLATEIIPGHKPGRDSATERTIMSHMGMPALDAATAHLLVTEAQRRGVGTLLRLF